MESPNSSPARVSLAVSLGPPCERKPSDVSPRLQGLKKKLGLGITSPKGMVRRQSFRSDDDLLEYREWLIDKNGLRRMPSELTSLFQPALVVDSMDELGPFERIGHGSSSSVYVATHTPSGTQVAVKELTLADPQARHQFFNELKIMITCNHRHIVQLYNCFSHNGFLYLILEYCGKGQLNSLISSDGGNHRLDESTLARYTDHMLQALAYLHEEAGVIHRDIKPQNMLVTEDDCVKITDFGVSRFLRSPSPFQQACGEAVGISPPAPLSPKSGSGDGSHPNSLSSVPEVPEMEYASRQGSGASDSAEQSDSGAGLGGELGLTDQNSGGDALGIPEASTLPPLPGSPTASQGNSLDSSSGGAGSGCVKSFVMPLDPDVRPRATSFTGTGAYMSPERIGGGSYTFEEGVWSLGLVVLELVLGRYPLPPDLVHGAIAAQEIEHFDFEPLFEEIDDPPLSHDLLDFLRSCLVKDPAQRPSARALLSKPFIQSQGTPT